MSVFDKKNQRFETGEKTLAPTSKVGPMLRKTVFLSIAATQLITGCRGNVLYLDREEDGRPLNPHGDYDSGYGFGGRGDYEEVANGDSMQGDDLEGDAEVGDAVVPGDSETGGDETLPGDANVGDEMAPGDSALGGDEYTSDNAPPGDAETCDPADLLNITGVTVNDNALNDPGSSYPNNLDNEDGKNDIYPAGGIFGGRMGVSYGETFSLEVVPVGINNDPQDEANLDALVQLNPQTGAIVPANSNYGNADFELITSDAQQGGSLRIKVVGTAFDGEGCGTTFEGVPFNIVKN